MSINWGTSGQLTSFENMELIVSVAICAIPVPTLDLLF